MMEEKSSSICRIQTILQRTSKGQVLVTIRAHPDVEEFMKGLSGSVNDPSIVAVASYGRLWQPVSEEKLQAYELNSTGLNELRTDDGFQVVFNRLGVALIDHGNQIINLSHLRLVGISEGAGVTFEIKGLYSDELLIRMRNLFGSAQKRFYSGFLKPVHLTVTTNTQNLSV